MQLPLGQLAQLLGGELTDPSRAEVPVSNVRALDAAGPGDLAFLWKDSYREAAKQCQAEAIVCREALDGVTCILVPDPEGAMLALLGQVHALRFPEPSAGVHAAAHVDPGATLGEGVSVGPGAVVEAGARIGDRTQIRARAYVGPGVRIGADAVVHPNATVLAGTRAGDRVVIHSGAVIGKAGFGFAKREGRHVRIPQVGGVLIEDDVEVGALTTVARGAVEDTILRRGVKIDDHCHVAHGCDLGENVMLVGYARMGGSVTIGKDAYILQDGAVGVGRTVGEGGVIGSGAKARYDDVAPGERVLGDPARPHMLTKRIEGSLPKLPEMRRRLKRLERLVAALEARPGIDLASPSG